jgi:acetoin:2,6-dichlorophenolindophenol oxidoreductase subunit beta
MPEITTYAKAVAAALRLLLTEDAGVFLAGEDIGVYGGAFGVTDGLLAEFGAERVRDTPISEDAIAGMAVGAAITGMRPVVEMQFSDFVVNAMDAIVNQAAKLHFMYGGNVEVPMVSRAPGGGGTGAAAQHSQSLEAWFAHVPGLKVVLPATVQDAHDLLLASVLDPNPVILLEHKLLYKTEGPFEARERIADTPARLGEATVLREGTDLTIAAYSIMTVRAMEAAAALAEVGISAEVVDLRTVRPLDIDSVRRSVKKTGRLLITHEAPTAAGVGAEVAAGVVESDSLDHLLAPVRRVCGRDIPMPYARALERAAIPQVEDVVDAAKELMKA